MRGPHGEPAAADETRRRIEETLGWTVSVIPAIYAVVKGWQIARPARPRM